MMNTIVISGIGDWANGSMQVGWDNLLTRPGTTVTVTSAEDGWPEAGLKNWRPKDRWQATSSADQTITVDTGGPNLFNGFGLYKHNLGTIGATIQAQVSNDAGGPWENFGPGQTPDSNDTIFRVPETQAITRRYFRLQITGASAPAILGVLFAGPTMRWHSGVQPDFSPTGMDYNDEILNSESQGGEFLGRRVIRRGGMSTLELRFGPPAWVRANYRPFLEAAALHPFFLGWSVEQYPSEVGFAYSAGAIQPVKRGPPTFERHSMRIVTR